MNREQILELIKIIDETFDEKGKQWNGCWYDKRTVNIKYALKSKIYKLGGETSEKRSEAENV